MVIVFPFCRESKDTLKRSATQVNRQIVMDADSGPLVIVETGPFQTAIRPLETKWSDQVKMGAGVSTQANDIARIRRNFRLEQNDVEQGRLPVLFVNNPG